MYALAAIVLAVIVMTLVWAWQLRTQNAGIVDAWWSYNFGLIALLYFLLTPNGGWVLVVSTTMAVIWSVRLGTYLFIRSSGHDKEDQRYADLREEYGANAALRMWLFFFYQALSNVFLSLPFLLIAIHPAATLSWHVAVGVVVWLIALFGESAADQQLKRFKANLDNKGKVCRVGLWKYSRHPNYFFEWLIWMGFALMALGVPYGWLAWICPVVMYFLLNRVTGIPLLEKQQVKSKGQAYKDYQATTSAFFPWFPTS